MWFGFHKLKLKLKAAAKEEEEGFPVFSPFSLSLPIPNLNLQVEEGGRKSCKPYNFGSTDSFLPHIFVIGSMLVVSEIFMRQLLPRCVHWSQKDNVFLMLWSKVTRFLTTRLTRGLTKKEEIIEEVVVCRNLPPEIWGAIGKRLASRLDILSFRSVCEVWRSSLPSPIRFPLQVPPPPSCDPEFLKAPFFITELTLYYAKWGMPGYLEFEEVDQGGKFRAQYLAYLDGKIKVASDNVISFMESPPHSLTQISFCWKAYRLRMGRSHQKRSVGSGQWDLQPNDFVRKIVLISSNNAEGVNPSYVKASDLSVVAQLSRGPMQGRLALLRLGGSPHNWVWDAHFCTQVFEDIATYKGQLCTLDLSGRVFLMDYNSLQMTQVAPLSPEAWGITSKNFFEACGDLYLADFSNHRVGYKFSFLHQKWLPYDNIRALTYGHQL